MYDALSPFLLMEGFNTFPRKFNMYLRVWKTMKAHRVDALMGIGIAIYDLLLRYSVGLTPISILKTREK